MMKSLLIPMRKISLSIKGYQLTLMLMFLLFAGMAAVNGQSIKHPVSEISTTTVKYYSYVHPLNDTVGVEIKYFIIKASNGNIKTALDACDVCWQYYLGYVKLSFLMRCVNCSNTYPIVDLGTAGTGGCWPGYLPHTIVDDSIVILKTDLATGSYMFKEVVITPPSGINDELSNDFSYLIDLQSDRLVLNMDTKAKRLIQIVGLNGQIHYSKINATSEVSLNIAGLASGVYILSVEENGKVYGRRFNVQ